VQVVEGGDGGGEVALGVVQLLDVPCDLLDLQESNGSDGADGSVRSDGSDGSVRSDGSVESHKGKE